MTELPKFLKEISNKIEREFPFLIKENCIKCGECAREEVCDTIAISFIPRKYPKFDKNKCNSCFKCLDYCSYKAIIPKKSGILGLFNI
ncbi:MAG: hypothetical protein GY870_07470 [archaeon]|nr:hypothetical protein [archaeon]